MQKLRTFFYVLIKTFTSPSYYVDIIEVPFSFSLKFFFFYFFLFSLIATSVISARSIFPLKPFVDTLPQRAERIFPEELEIKIVRGEATTNVDEPYFISVKRFEDSFSDKKILGENYPPIDNILVIDTQGKIEDIFKYKTATYLTKNHLVVVEEDGKLESYSLSQVDDLTINKDGVSFLIGKIAPFLNLIIPLAIFLVFISTLIFFPMSGMAYLLFFSLIFLLLAKVLSVSIRYGKLYQLGLHLLVPVTSLFSLLNLIDLELSFPFLRTIIMALLSFVVLKKLQVRLK